MSSPPRCIYRAADTVGLVQLLDHVEFVRVFINLLRQARQLVYMLVLRLDLLGSISWQLRVEALGGSPRQIIGLFEVKG